MTRDELLAYFEDTTAKMVRTMSAKNADYAGDADEAFQNFMYVELFGVASAEQGFFTRMTDKFSRLATFIKIGVLQVADEKIEDTLIDLATYSLLLAAYIKEKRATGDKRPSTVVLAQPAAPAKKKR